MKKASSAVFWFLKALIRPALARKYNFYVEQDDSFKRPCLIMCNHQAGYDQFAAGMPFSFGINYVASDSIFRHGFQSWLMKTLTRPIPFNKGTSDPTAIKNMIEVIADGGAVGIFPEGNRCYFGETMTVQPGTGRLAKKLNVPLILMRLRGGYLTKPRWKIKPNKGKVTIEIVKIVPTEELAHMSNEEVQKLIETSLYVNEYEYNAEQKQEFLGKARAEHLEALLFYCPCCKTFDKLGSTKHDFYCTECGMRTTIDTYGLFSDTVEPERQNIIGLQALEQIEKFPTNILEWSKQQLSYVENFDFSLYKETPVFKDDNIRFSIVVRAKKEKDVQKGTIALFSDRFKICDTTIMLSDIRGISINEVRRLTIYTTTETYCVDTPLKYNLVKYMICGYKIKHETEGKPAYYGY